MNAPHEPDPEPARTTHRCPPGQYRHAFTIRGRIQSFRCAFAGVWFILRSQQNAWVHALATVSVVALAGVLQIDAIGWALVLMAVAGVWVAEAFNTALEVVSDAIQPEYHASVGVAKDIGAGAVLFAALNSIVIGLLVLGPPVAKHIGL